MFLNETKPPLSEVIEHSGVKGMRWGVHRQERYTHDPHDFSVEPKKHSVAKKVAIGSLVLVGSAVAVAMLSKHGSVKMNDLPKIPKAKPFANRSFRPDDVRNPLFTVHKKPKAAKDFVDAGFGKNGVFNVTTMTRGAKRVKDFDADIWEAPVLALTSGRR